MGRKYKKEKRKCIKRKEKKAQLLVAKKSIKEANGVIDPLDDFSAFRQFDKNDFKAYIEFKNVNEIDEETFTSIFSLIKNNMENFYNTCSWGWNEMKKIEEMKEKTAKYLIARNEQNEIIGFTHFRFDMDYGEEVLYCYELQLDLKTRRKGLGKFLLQILELIAFKNNMKKVILTVLKHNVNAVNFFFSLKYEIDETDPGVFEDVPYMILSKCDKSMTQVRRTEIK